MTDKKRPGLVRLIVCLALLVAMVVIMVVEPAARHFGISATCVILAAAAWSLAEVLALEAPARGRAAGIAFLLLAFGFGCGGFASWARPDAMPEPPFPRPGPTMQLIIGAVGALIFGAIGAVALWPTRRSRR